MDYLAGHSLEQNLAHLSPDGLAIELGKVFMKFDEDMLMTISKKALVGHDLNPEAIAEEAFALVAAEEPSSAQAGMATRVLGPQDVLVCGVMAILYLPYSPRCSRRWRPW
jgi:hypothetical protein